MLKEYSTVIIEIFYNDNLFKFCFFQKAWKNFGIAPFPPIIKILGWWSINGVFNFRFLSFDFLEAEEEEEEVFDGRKYTLWNISKQRFIKTDKTKTVVFDKFYCWVYLWYEVSNVWLNTTFVKQDGITLRTPPHTQMQSTPLFINLLSEALPNITISKAYTCGSMFKYTPSQSSYSRQVLPALEACTLVTIFFKYFHL